jgi:hypothetical protein
VSQGSKILYLELSDEETKLLQHPEAPGVSQSVSQAVYKNSGAEDYFEVHNKFETGDAVKEIGMFIENYQQSKKDKDDEKKEEKEEQASLK